MSRRVVYLTAGVIIVLLLAIVLLLGQLVRQEQPIVTSPTWIASVMNGCATTHPYADRNGTPDYRDYADCVNAALTPGAN